QGQRTTWNEAITTIARGDFGKHRRLYIEQRTEPTLEPQAVFTYLLKTRVFRPRLAFLARLLRSQQGFRCKRCGLRSSIHVKSFEGAWTCPDCGYEHDMPGLIGDEFRRRRNEWSFEKAGLFSRDNNQEGALPVILTLLQLEERMRSRLIYSTALNLTADRSCEV